MSLCYIQSAGDRVGGRGLRHLPAGAAVRLLRRGGYRCGHRYGSVPGRVIYCSSSGGSRRRNRRCNNGNYSSNSSSR